MFVFCFTDENIPAESVKLSDFLCDFCCEHIWDVWTVRWSAVLPLLPCDDCCSGDSVINNLTAESSGCWSTGGGNISCVFLWSHGCTQSAHKTQLSVWDMSEGQLKFSQLTFVTQVSPLQLSGSACATHPAAGQISPVSAVMWWRLMARCPRTHLCSWASPSCWQRLLRATA